MASTTSLATNGHYARPWRNERTARVAAHERRHPSLEALEDDLRWITWARTAPPVPDLGAVGLAVLPTMLWRAGPADHPKSRDGLLPHPITWNRSHLVAFTDSERVIEATWTARAWGTRTSGRVRLVVDADAPPSRALTIVDGDDLVDSSRHADGVIELVVSPMTTMSVRAGVRQLERQAVTSRWAVHERLQPWLNRALTAAHRGVSAELKVVRVLDEFALEDVLTEVHLGTADRPGLIDRVIDRLTGSSSRPNVDAGRYIATTFRRDAELAIRRRIDDPRWVGVALRRFAADHPELSGRELVDRFNDSACLAERIGIGRAARALAPAIQPVVVNVPFELLVPTFDLVDDSWATDSADADTALRLVS